MKRIKIIQKFLYACTFLLTTILLVNNNVYAQKRMILNQLSTHNQATINLHSRIEANPDTLSNKNIVKNYNVTFGVEGGDILAVWFVCPQDLIIKSVGIDAADNPNNVRAEIKIKKVNSDWTAAKLFNQGSQNLGYWISTSNADNIYPYKEDISLNKKWVTNTNDAYYPFGEDLWSDSSKGAPLVPLADGLSNTYQWIDMTMLNKEPVLKKGEIFAVCIKNMELKLSNGAFGIAASNETGYGVFKYYSDGRIKGDITTAGWWKREYLVNVAVAVEITGDEAPTISDVDILPTTLSKSAREVKVKIVDTNPSGGIIGVASAYIQYYLNEDVTWKEAAMTKSAGDFYIGNIPGQQGGTKVTYRIKAIDVNGNISYSEPTNSYYVYAPTSGTNSLLVLNGMDPEGIDKYPMNSYFNLTEQGKSIRWKHDVWAYGPLTTELVENYSNIFEICSSENSGEKIEYNDSVIRAWLLKNGNRNYALAGQEWLGVRYGFIDKNFAPGTFEYDVLGIAHSYNDVCNNSNSIKPSRVYAKSNSLLGDELYKKFTAWGTDSLQYDPYYELNKTENWIDGFEVVSGQAVDMEVETMFVGGVAKKQNSATITHRVLSGGNKIAFMGYDPIAVNTKSPKTNAKYFCFGTTIQAPQVKVLQWFNLLTDVENEKNALPANFVLYQNYPNPFNPTTVISYQISVISTVQLKVFNILGREVVTLVNEEKLPGSYEVKFDGNKIPSGIYFYQLRSGTFVETKKFVLMK